MWKAARKRVVIAEKEVARDPTSSSHACKLAYLYLTLWDQRNTVFVSIEPKGIIIVHGPIAGWRGILTTQVPSEYSGKDECRDLSEFIHAGSQQRLLRLWLRTSTSASSVMGSQIHAHDPGLEHVADGVHRQRRTSPEQ